MVMQAEYLKNSNPACHFTFARRQGVLNVRMSAFDPVRKKLKRQPVIPKTISHKTVNTIEQWIRHGYHRNNDRQGSFSVQLICGRHAPVDICFLRHRCIKEDVIVYERIKCDKIARPVLLDKS